MESKLRPKIHILQQLLNNLNIRTQARDKKLRKIFNYNFQFHIERTCQALGSINFTRPHKCIACKGVNMHEVYDGTRSEKIKSIYIVLQNIIRIINSEYAGDNNDWVVNISAMTKGSHYNKKPIDKEDIDSQNAFTLGSFPGGILRSYNNLGIMKDINNFRRVVRFDGRLPHEVSQVLSGCRYSVIFFKLYDRRMTRRSAPILNNPKFVTNFIAP